MAPKKNNADEGSSSSGPHERRAIRSTSKRAGLILPAGRVVRLMKEGRFGHRVRKETGVALTAALEYIALEILEVAGEATHNDKRKKISTRDITIGMRKDADLNKLLGNATIRDGGVIPGAHMLFAEPHEPPPKRQRKPRPRAKSGTGPAPEAPATPEPEAGPVE